MPSKRSPRSKPIQDEGATSSDPIPSLPEPATATGAPLPRGKLGAMVALLQRPQGATVADLVEATGWQAHSVRGAMAGGLKHRGFKVSSERNDGVRVYRLPAPVSAEPSPEGEA